MSMLSVVIPTCLRDIELLCRAIDSVLCNGLDDLEIVVVNDNPKLDIEKNEFLLSKYANDNIILRNNLGKHGAGSARNYGVNIASSEFISFLDDDDLILHGRLKHMMAIMNEQPSIKLVSSGRIYEYGGFSRLEVIQKQVFGLICLEDVYINNQIDIGFLIRRVDFLSLGGFDTSFQNLEDWDFIIRCLKTGNAFKVESYSYVVKNDLSGERVSNNDYIGMNKLAAKHREGFGDAWYYKLKTLALRSQGRLNIFNACKLLVKSRSFYSLENYFKTLIKKFLI